jgi:hypothetical protein
MCCVWLAKESITRAYECSLVDYGWNDYWLDEDSQQAMTGCQHWKEISVMHTDLPNPYQPKQPTPASQLFHLRNIAPVPAFVDEQDN